MSAPHQVLSGTALGWGGAGILLLGPTGSGKSDLAIRLIEAGALLVSDDVVELRREDDRVWLSFPTAAPSHLRGRIEARGVGIVKVPAATAPIALALVVGLVSPDKVERLPDIRTITYLGLTFPKVELTPFEASSVAKVRLALHHRDGDIIPAP